MDVKPGDKVICNGFPGIIIRVIPYATSLVEVRLNSGVVVSEVKFLKEAK